MKTLENFSSETDEVFYKLGKMSILIFYAQKWGFWLSWKIRFMVPTKKTIYGFGEFSYSVHVNNFPNCDIIFAVKEKSCVHYI